MPASFSRQCVLLMALIFMGFWTGPQPAPAAWSTNPSINNAVAVNPGHNNAKLMVAPYGQGGSLVLIARADTLVVQRINPDGSLAWLQPTVVVAGTTVSGGYDLLALGDGSCFVSYTKLDPLGSSFSAVFVNQIDPAGNVLWSNGVEAAYTGSPMIGQQRHPNLGFNDNGWIIVTWEDRRAGPYNIYAQAIDQLNGLRQWSNLGKGIAIGAAVNSSPVVFETPSGNNVFAWIQETAFTNVYKKVLDLDGNEVIPAQWLYGSDAGYLFEVVNPMGNALIITAGSTSNIWGHFLDDQGFDRNGSPQFRLLATTTLTKTNIAVTSDNQGGVFLSWWNMDSGGGLSENFVQHVDAGSSPLWGSPGRNLGPVTINGRLEPSLCRDGFGGVFVITLNSTLQDAFVDHLDQNGNYLWSSPRLLTSHSGSSNMLFSLFSDTKGGLVGIFNNQIYDPTISKRVYAQNMDYFGYLGDMSPVAISALDFPLDQGGVLRLDWQASYLDALGQDGLDHYSIWRRYAGGAKQAGTDTADPAASGLAPAAITAQKAAGWNYVANSQAMYQGVYSFDAPTYGDSTAAAMPVTEFKIIAHGKVVSGSYWESNIVAGTSVDNLAPGAPLALTATSATGSPRLSWQPSGYHDSDLANYRLYRGTVPGVIPSPGSLVASATDTVYVDPVGSGTWYYIVTAVDIHGNESLVSNEAWTLNVSGVPGVLVTAARITGASPNPFNPRTVIHYELPATEPVRLTLYNLLGQKVRVLVDDTLPGGRHTIAWDGTSDRGLTQPSGVYLVRMVTSNGVESRKIMLAK